jgi:hypothetical protein
LATSAATGGRAAGEEAEATGEALQEQETIITIIAMSAARTAPSAAMEAGAPAAATESIGPGPISKKILVGFFFRSRPLYIYLKAVD